MGHHLTPIINIENVGQIKISPSSDRAKQFVTFKSEYFEKYVFKYRQFVSTFWILFIFEKNDVQKKIVSMAPSVKINKILHRSKNISKIFVKIFEFLNCFCKL